MTAMRSLIVSASPWSWVTKMNVMSDLALDPLELELHRLAQLEVECGERFVEQQGAGQVDERPGQGDALLLAAGQLVRAALGELAEADDVEHLHRAPASLAATAPSWPAVRTPTLSSTDMCGNRAYCWKTVLTLRLCGGTFDTSTPSSMTLPDVGSSKPAIILSRVVLPQPDGPSSEKNSPRPIEKSARSTATKSPNSLRTASRTMTSPSPGTSPSRWLVGHPCTALVARRPVIRPDRRPPSTCRSADRDGPGRECSGARAGCFTSQ